MCVCARCRCRVCRTRLCTKIIIDMSARREPLCCTLCVWCTENKSPALFGKRTHARAELSKCGHAECVICVYVCLFVVFVCVCESFCTCTRMTYTHGNAHALRVSVCGVRRNCRHFLHAHAQANNNDVADSVVHQRDRNSFNLHARRHTFTTYIHDYD